MYSAVRDKIESLWYAAYQGDNDKIEKILNKGLHDVNGLNYWQSDIDPNGWNRTPLHAAVLGSNLETVRYLLEKGADVNARTKYGDTPMHFAVEANSEAMIQLLMQYKADITLK